MQSQLLASSSSFQVIVPVPGNSVPHSSWGSRNAGEQQGLLVSVLLSCLSLYKEQAHIAHLLWAPWLSPTSIRTRCWVPCMPKLDTSLIQACFLCRLQNKAITCQFSNGSAKFIQLLAAASIPNGEHFQHQLSPRRQSWESMTLLWGWPKGGFTQSISCPLPLFHLHKTSLFVTLRKKEYYIYLSSTLSLSSLQLACGSIRWQQEHI